MKDLDETDRRLLVTARLLWQQGNWEALSKLPVAMPPRPDPAAVEVLLYKTQSAFLTGALDLARDHIAALHKMGVGRNAIVTSLASGAYSSLSRAWMMLDASDRAARSARKGVALNPHGGDPDIVLELRLAQERKALIAEKKLKPHARREKSRDLFIDCGGYDGCSALSFLLSHPHHDCVTFEPNPDLWRHYKDIPTQLIRKAAFTYDGEIAFTVDPVDSDGSTVVKGKRIDARRTIEDDECPVVTVPCIDLSAFVKEAAQRYERIVLKLDVEGAEYDILEKMLDDDTIRHLDHLYCEFHSHKMEMDPARHADVLDRLSEQVVISDWDGLPLSIIAEDSTKLRKERRKFLIKTVLDNRNRLFESD